MRFIISPWVRGLTAGGQTGLPFSCQVNAFQYICIYVHLFFSFLLNSANTELCVKLYDYLSIIAF